jgi:hypothetical protein
MDLKNNSIIFTNYFKSYDYEKATSFIDINLFNDKLKFI